MSSHIYLDFNIINNTDRKKLAREYVTLPSSVLDNPNEYTLSIIRFLLQPSDLPVHIFRIEQGITQTDPNKGKFQIGFRYVPSGNLYMENIEWEPEESGFVSIPPPPPSVNNGLQKDDQYYFMYSYKHLAYLANKAIVVAVDSLNLAEGTAFDYPQIVFDEKRGTYDLYMPLDFTEGVSAADVSLMINEDSLKFLEGQIYYYDSIAQLYEMKALQQPLFLNAYWLPTEDPASDPVGWYFFPAEFSVLEKLHSPKKIIFTSNTLPIIQEWVNTQNIYSNRTDTSESLPIISDFSIVSNQAGSSMNDYLYVPQAEYRRLNLNHAAPIKNIDVTIYWIDDYNVLWPLELRKGSLSSCKMLFERKS